MNATPKCKRCGERDRPAGGGWCRECKRAYNREYARQRRRAGLVRPRPVVEMTPEARARAAWWNHRRVWERRGQVDRVCSAEEFIAWAAPLYADWAANRPDVSLRLVLRDRRGRFEPANLTPAAAGLRRSTRLATLPPPPAGATRCRDCGAFVPLGELSEYQQKRPEGSRVCRGCASAYQRSHRRTARGWAASMWRLLGQRRHSRCNRAVELRCSREEFVAWAEDQFAAWERSHPGVTPTVERRSEKGHFELANLRLLPGRRQFLPLRQEAS